MHIFLVVMLTAPVTKNGDTALGLAICLEKLDLVKYLVTECGVDINGESSRTVCMCGCGS